jgi:hypothetical protein
MRWRRNEGERDGEEESCKNGGRNAAVDEVCVGDSWVRSRNSEGNR